MSDEELVTVAEAARLLGVSKMTVYRRIEDEELTPVYDYRKFVHLRLSEVNDILRQIKIKNGEQDD